MMETWEEGGGVLWGSVVAVQPHVQLQVLGAVFPNWGGPTQWYATWDIEPSGDRTVLKFSEHAIGSVSESGIQEKLKGWQILMIALTAHLEVE